MAAGKRSGLYVITLFSLVFTAGTLIILFTAGPGLSQPDANDWPFWGSYSPLRVLKAKPPVREPWTFVAYGDTRAANFHRNYGVPALCRLNPALIVHTGDAIKHGGGIWTRNVDWIRWELESRALRDSIPFFPVIGECELSDREPRTEDHEQGYTGIQHFTRIYSLPGESGWDPWYSFAYGGVTFVVLADLEHSLFPGSPQWIWLERTLREAATPHVIAVSHLPVHTAGDGNHSDWPYASQLTALMKRYGVGLHISGHARFFSRTVRDGITHVVSAGGGGEMQPLPESANPGPDEVCFTGAGREDGEDYFYYTAFEVNGGTITGAAVSFKTGRVFDTFRVAARKSGAQ